MSENYQQVTSSNLIAELTSRRASPGISESYTNSFTCINTAVTSSNTWPFRVIAPVHDDPIVSQRKIRAHRVPSKLRKSIMHRAQRLARPSHTAELSSDGTQSMKRKSSGAATQQREEPQSKRLKPVTLHSSATLKHGDNSYPPTKSIEPEASTAISTKTMSELNAFKVSANKSGNLKESSDTHQADLEKYQHKVDDQALATKSEYVMKDHSSRLIQSGREELARLSEIQPINIYGEASSGRQHEDEHAPTEHEPKGDIPVEPKSRYKMKDHSSRLIRAGFEEMQKAQGSDTATLTKESFDFADAPFTQYKTRDNASRPTESRKKELDISTKQVDCVVHEDRDDSEITGIGSPNLLDVMDNFDDLDSSIFDISSLDRFEFEDDTFTSTSGITEMDDMDDSIFEQIMANDDAKCNEIPSSAQPEIKRFNNDTTSSPIRPGLMLPPKLPSLVSPPKNVSAPDGRRKGARLNTPISPFIRPPGAELVTSPSAIPSLNAGGRVVTCFRLAEMFRETSSPLPPPAIEIFAIVKASVRDRDGTSQSFTFADLFFPQRPPYVHGIYGKCSESELFDDDSRPFLKAGQRGQGILARAIVRLKPKSDKMLLWNQKNGFCASEETSAAMEVEVLSIFVCPWEDIEYTKGIVMPEKEVWVKQEGEPELFYMSKKKRRFSPLEPVGNTAALKDVDSNVPSSPAKMTGR